MTRAQHTAHRLRRWILVAGIVYTLGVVFWLALPLVDEFLLGMEFEVFGLLGTPVTLGTLYEQGVISYVINVLLVLALLLELPDWWAVIMGGAGGNRGYGGWGIVGVWTAMLLVWGIWAWVFFVYCRQGDRYQQMGKVVRELVAGSFLEVFLAVPVHIWATRQRDCHCCRGTYTTLVFAGAVLLWAFGPGIVLLYKHEEYRREKLLRGQAIECSRCGYDLRGTLSAGIDRCPECGAPALAALKKGA